MSETSAESRFVPTEPFVPEDDLRRVTDYANKLLGNPFDEEGNEQWAVVVDPEELDIKCGPVIRTCHAQYLVLDKEKTDGRDTFREIGWLNIPEQHGPSARASREVVGITGRMHMEEGDDRTGTVSRIGRVGVVSATYSYGGYRFW